MDDLVIKQPILLIGVGGAGCRIAAAASSVLGCNCIFISNDKKDLKTGNFIFIDSKEWVNPSSYKLRAFAQSHIGEIRSAMSGYSTIIIVSNLAGRAGNAIAPLVSKAANSLGETTVISVAIMPFKFEKDRIFHAGVSLRRIRESSHATIVIDNDALLESNPELSLEKCYEITNRAIIEVVSSISSNSRVEPEMSVLCTSKNNTSSAESSLRDSIAMLYENVSDTDSIRRAMLYVIGGEKVPVGTLDSLASTVRGIFKIEGATEVAMSMMSGAGPRIHLVVSTPKTRFDRYDPLGDIIPRDKFLDWEEMDSSPDIEIMVPNVE